MYNLTHIEITCVDYGDNALGIFKMDSAWSAGTGAVFVTVQGNCF
ncbi:hypothetical protein KKB3_00602, partial [Dehalococcoides mccartyi]